MVQGGAESNNANASRYAPDGCVAAHRKCVSPRSGKSEGSVQLNYSTLQRSELSESRRPAAARGNPEEHAR